MRQVERIVDEALASLDAEFDRLCAAEGWLPIPPERLMRASLIRILFSVRVAPQARLRHDAAVDGADGLQSDLPLVVCLCIDGAVWVPTVPTKNRHRLLTTEMSRKFLAALLANRAVASLLSDERFSIDGARIGAWASMKSLQPRPQDAPPDGGGPGEPPAAAPDPNADEPAPEMAAETAPMPEPARRDRNAEGDFRGERRSNGPRWSAIGPSDNGVSAERTTSCRLCV